MISATTRNKLYIAGGPGGGSIGPAIHEYIGSSLGLDWTCEFLRFSDVSDVMNLFHRDDFAGGLVTMPHKRTIIPLLDSMDDDVSETGSCNLVVRKPNGDLHAMNTDWLGIVNAIEAEPTYAAISQDPQPIGLVYGAGGASRAAVYGLVSRFRCETIYVVNRDKQEVTELVNDVKRYTKTVQPRLIHITSVEQASDLQCPRYIICTVPDFEPRTPSELKCRAILVHFLGQGRGQQNIVLDMCYHPPMTRSLKAGVQASWATIPGYLVVCHQFAKQWNEWTGRDIDTPAAFKLCDRLVRKREASGATTVS